MPPPEKARAWRIVPAEPSSRLNAIWGTAANNIWAVGNGGRVMHYDGSRWQPMWTPTDVNLHGVFGQAADQVIAAGHVARGWDVIWTESALIQFNGKRWTSLVSPVDFAPPAGIWGTSTGPLWFAGGGEMEFGVAGIPSVWKKTGSVWESTNLNNLFSAEDLGPYGIVPRGQWGPNADEFWIVSGWPIGIQPPPPPTQLIHYLNGQWSTATLAVPNEARAIWGTSANDIWIVGRGGLLVHKDSTWNLPTSSPSEADLFSVWGPAANNYWAVGANGTILHYDGEAWSSVASPVETNLNAVWGSSATDVWAVGDQGVILHYGIVPEDDDLPLRPAAATRDTVIETAEHLIVEGVFSDPDRWTDFAELTFVMNHASAPLERVELAVVRSNDPDGIYLFLKEQTAVGLSFTRGPCRLGEEQVLTSALLDVDCAATTLAGDGKTVQVRWAIRLNPPSEDRWYDWSVWGRDWWGHETGETALGLVIYQDGTCNIQLGSF